MSNIRFSDALNIEAMEPVETNTVGLSLVTLATTNLLNLSGVRGRLRSLGWRTAATLSSAGTVTLTITIDGGTPMVLTIFGASTVEHGEISAYKRYESGAIATNGTKHSYDFGGIPFNVSCVVSITVSVSMGGSAAADLTVIHEVPV
jgi:hypothetical protein